MAFFKVKIDGKVHSLERLTIGESRVLRRDFGLSDMEKFNGTDPDQLAGLLYIAMARGRGLTVNPREPLNESLLAEVEDIDIETFEPQPGDEDPTPAAPAAEDESASNGKSGTTRKTSGSRN